jgi:nitrite reductase/ring-hydroxylating ferredoxin subunit
VRGRFTSDVVGDISVLDDEPMLVCPWHAWGFRLDTGECTVDASLRVKRYDVVVEDERVFVNLPAR